MTPRPLLSRDDVVTAAQGHPYARFSVAVAPPERGLTCGDAVVWVTTTPFGVLGHALGPSDAVAGLFAYADERGIFTGVRSINLPAGGATPAGYSPVRSWDLRWLTVATPPQPGEDRVVELMESDDDAVHALLDLSMPEALVRPGHPVVRQFFGIREGGRLVACAADRSGGEPGNPDAVGILGGVAVHPQFRGRGYGAAVSAAAARRLARYYRLVVLGVNADNSTASRLYLRLGFTDVQPITPVRSR